MAISTPAQFADYLCDITKHSLSFWKENAEKVCEDEEDIHGKIVIVTGSNTGIGKMTALQLAKRGAVVIMAVRSLEKGQVALDDIKKRIGEDVKIELMQIDLGDLESIRAFVKNFESKYPHLNILVNNAGFMDTNGVLTKTKDGFEQHIGVNHLGPLLLTRLLVNSLKKGAPSRIVSVSSSNLAIAPFDLDNDPMMEQKVKTGDDGKEPYNFSKLANSICMIKFAQMLDDSGIKLLLLCPGFVNSDVFRNETGFFKNLKNTISLSVVGITPHSGSETVVYLSVAKSVIEAEGAGKGEMYRFKKLWERGNKILKDYDNSEKSEILYKMSEELVGLREKQLVVDENKPSSS